MRLASWFGAVLIAAAVATGLGAVALARQHPVSSHVVTSANQQAAREPFSALDDGLPDPPPVFPTPSPTPTAITKPVVKPPAPASTGSAPAKAKPPSIVIGSTQQALINQDRAAHGLGPLTWNSCLYNVAVSNAKRIAAQGYLSHTGGPQADLSCGLGHQAGENIGDWSGGINDAKLNSMFMASPDHYANIMGPYHYVATAWVVASNGYGYIAVEFS